MGEVFQYYKRPDPTTWVFLSSFLSVGLFFVFHRFWSIRNLDLILLLMLGPGVLVVHRGYQMELAAVEGTVQGPTTQPAAVPVESSSAKFSSGESSVTESPATVIEDSREEGPVAERVRARRIRRGGFLYLFVVELLWVVRLVLDPMKVRRPRLSPNLTGGGLSFIGISLFLFMAANVVNATPRSETTQGPRLGPGYPMMNSLPALPTRGSSSGTVDLIARRATPAIDAAANPVRPPAPTGPAIVLAKTLAIASNLVIVLAIVLICDRHFDHFQAGVGAATLYLLLPSTAQLIGRVDHALPAAALLLAVLMYRRPMVAGVLIGLAAGLVYYPFFLLPLWLAFYWTNGARQFAVGFAAAVAALMVLLALDDSRSMAGHLQQMFGILSPLKEASELHGYWSIGVSPIWRLPVIVGFVILSIFVAIWPSEKNLGTLISGGAALMAAAQFWHGYGGGLYVAWFVPLALLVIVRPNLQDRVAAKVVRRDGTVRREVDAFGPAAA